MERISAPKKFDFSRLRELAANAPAETPGVKCQLCTDKKWKDVLVGGVWRTTRCDCWLQGQPRGRVMIGRAGVGDRFADFTFETFATKFAGDVMCEKFATWVKLWSEQPNDKRSDLVMAGPNGTGKTGLAVAALRAAIDQGAAGYFVELEALSIRWRATYGRRSDIDEPAETEAEVFEHLTTVDVLIVDELTGSKATDFVEDKLRAIIVARQRANLPTILTLNVERTIGTAGNVDGDKFQRAIAVLLGPTLFDKLRERAQFFPMFGPSKRTPYKTGRG